MKIQCDAIKLVNKMSKFFRNALMLEQRTVLLIDYILHSHHTAHTHTNTHKKNIFY